MDSLRAMVIRAGASRRQRWPLVLAGLALVIVQLAAMSHLIGHAAAGDNSDCAICLAAGGSAGAAPAAFLAPPVFQPITSQVIEPIATQLSARVLTSYRARAPPVSA